MRDRPSGNGSTALRTSGNPSAMLKRILRTLAERNYCTARALYVRRLKQEHLKYTKPPVLVFTMGKVGSQTIRSSLRAAQAELDMPIYNTHFLADKHGFTR